MKSMFIYTTPESLVHHFLTMRTYCTYFILVVLEILNDLEIIYIDIKEFAAISEPEGIKTLVFNFASLP